MTRIHLKTLGWALEALENGRIVKDEFEILLFCACRVDWNTMHVRSYSAGQVCLFYRLDANEANRKRYERALKGLEQATNGAVHDDYRHCRVGNERTYVVFLPRESPWNDAVSICTPLSHTAVAQDVAASESINPDAQKAYEENTEGVSQPVSHRKPEGMSITNQGAVKTTQPEKDPLPPLGVSPLPSPSGMRSSGAGLLESTPSQEDKPLTAKQCDALAEIVTDFRLAWSHRYGFDPDKNHALALLRNFNPWEIDIAYCTLRNGGSVRNNTTAVFFRKTAADLIRRHREEIGLVYPNREDCGFTDFDAVQSKWCELFRYDAPLKFWRDENDFLHFYRPELEMFLWKWGREIKAAAELEQKKQEAEKKRQQAKQEAEETERSKREFEINYQRQREIKRQEAVVHVGKDLEPRGWTFDGKDKWSQYGGYVRVNEGGDKVSIIDSKGKIIVISVDDPELAYRASAID